MGDIGTTKGFGKVYFSSQDEADKAVTAMNGQVLEGKRLYVALMAGNANTEIEVIMCFF